MLPLTQMHVQLANAHRPGKPAVACQVRSQCCAVGVGRTNPFCPDAARSHVRGLMKRLGCPDGDSATPAAVALQPCHHTAHKSTIPPRGIDHTQAATHTGPNRQGTHACYSSTCVHATAVHSHDSSSTPTGRNWSQSTAVSQLVCMGMRPQGVGGTGAATSQTRKSPTNQLPPSL